jgi:alpha-glucosidase
MRPLIVFLLVNLAGLGVLASEWYKAAVIYQIYVRSFKDSDGDGIGDLKGVLSKVDYIKSLGVDAVWLSPIYPSPDADFGYDVEDYVNIDAKFGTLDDFNNLVAELKKNGIKVIMDFVPNHSSDEHEWFIKSRKSDPDYKDFYVWRPDPLNWNSMFRGPAWTKDPIRNEYYLHQFHVKQPDLNLKNPHVINKLQGVLRTWMLRGVSGFRTDAVFAFQEIYKNESRNWNVNDPDDYNYWNHEMTTDLMPDNLEVVQKFRKTLDDFQEGDDNIRILMTESYSDNYNTIKGYYGTPNNPGAHFPFNFFLIMKANKGYNNKAWVDLIKNWYKNMDPKNQANWVIGNHDQKRVATRFGENMVDIINALLLSLKGTAITYNGEEIGMTDGMVRFEQGKDPQGQNAGKDKFFDQSRDFQRTPFQWNNTANAGFNMPGNSTWLPVNPNYWRINVDAQEKATGMSHLKFYRKLVSLRKNHTMVEGKADIYDMNGSASNDSVIGIIRTLDSHPTIVTLLNLGEYVENVDVRHYKKTLPHEMFVYTGNEYAAVVNVTSVDTSKVRLLPKAAVVLTSIKF